MAFKMRTPNPKGALKQLKPRSEEFEKIGPRDEEGWFTTGSATEGGSSVSTRPRTGDASKEPVITGETEVKEEHSFRHTDPKTGQVYSTVRGPHAEHTEYLTTVGPEGEQVGTTKYKATNPISGSDFLTGEKDIEWYKSYFDKKGRVFDPKERRFSHYREKR